MTKETYKKNIYKLREINKKIHQIEDLLETDLLCGPIGELYDMIYTCLIPENAPDDIFEMFGNLIFEDEIADNDIDTFYKCIFNYEF